MARRKVRVNPNAKGIQEIPKAAKKGHDDTVQMIDGIRAAKNKMPRQIRDLFPKF
jgi:hypothetical protein